MTDNYKKFKYKINKLIPVDEFLNKALYEPKSGYYANRNPFGRNGDFVTAPSISNLFSEIISIWVVSVWEKLDKPVNFNFVELGPGDGSFTKVLLNTFQKFPKLNNSTKIYLYEKSERLKKIQKKKIRNRKVKWISNFDTIKKGPIIFFGNEFFDAIPVKQFSYKKKSLHEKFFYIDPISGINETYSKAKLEDKKNIKSYKTLNNLSFIEYPKLGFEELKNINKKILELSGGILLIDYGYLNNINKSTLQAVKQNQKINLDVFFDNIGKSDITYLVNFKLLKEYFIKNKLKVKNIVTQKFFLEKMGILERANILGRKMNFKEKKRMSSTLIRLLNKDLMGELFKVLFAFKSHKNNFLGFE